MTETIDLPRPPKPEVPEGKTAEWVEAYFKGTTAVPGHWRIRNAKPRKKKPGPKPGQPRNTTVLHARHLWEQLAIPLAYFIGRGDHVFEQDIIRECRTAIEDARRFIDRFTSTDE